MNHIVTTTTYQQGDEERAFEVEKHTNNEEGLTDIDQRTQLAILLAQVVVGSLQVLDVGVRLLELGLIGPDLALSEVVLLDKLVCSRWERVHNLMIKQTSGQFAK